MERVFWLLILVGFLVILGSLGSALYHLSRGTPEDSGKLLRDLTIRITVSLVLFALLMLAWHFGLIAPHAVMGSTPPRP
ncbi:MAG TPA: DUF2909 domain-containing protein [Steroidobacteraceae bacterium]|nr:DUF2909 domain-containing protein [Steroidobacteraceae bacterium]